MWKPKVNKYKAGQIVTINGKRYRLTKTTRKQACAACYLENSHKCICANAQSKFAKVCLNKANDCFLKEIPVKG